MTLWSIVILELILILILVYFSRWAYFISLFIVFIQLASPWFLIFNLAFLIYSLLTKEVEFTWEFWLNYFKELYRFFLLSFGMAVVVLIASFILGTILGTSAERVFSLSVIKDMQRWVAAHFY